LKREIPQKVNAKFGFADQTCSASVVQFWATLFRRTRSATLLSFTLAAGTFVGVSLTSQEAEAFPAKAPSLLGPVSSLPHLFNSADASSGSYASNYLDAQGSAAPLQIAAANESIHSSSIGFESNETLSTELSLQVQQEALQPVNLSTERLSPGSTDGLDTRALEDKANANAAGLTIEGSGVFVHKVRIGENLTEIAERYSISPETLAQANRISNPNVIEIHEDLVIPSVSLSAVAAAPLMAVTLAGDANTILQAAAQQGVSPELLNPQAPSASAPPPVQTSESVDLEAPQAINAQISEAGQNQLQSPHAVNTLALNETQPRTQVTPQALESSVARKVAFPQIPSLDLPTLVSADQFLPSTFQNDLKKYIWPARGAFTSGYGWRWGRMHRGIDIAAAVGTPIVSAASGVVVSAGWNDGGYGNLVEIRHPDGSVTVYAHNNHILTRVGAVVSQGELIAQMGSTGRSTGPHSHFEIRPRGSRAVDPMFFLSRS
jgi:murein DD-endopeptidase MepM/ murein hydrolase activator NlpD